MAFRARPTRALIAAMGILLCGLCTSSSHAATVPALRGVVSSGEEGKMEGVVVSAKRDGGNITVSVVSDSEGRYSFPGDRLPAANYHLKIRAAGYDLDGPDVLKVETGKTAQMDLKLIRTKNLAAQMTNADWFYSYPPLKENLIDGITKAGVPHIQACIGCHPLSVVMNSKFKGADWVTVLNKMANFSESSIYQPGELRIPANRPYKVPPNPQADKLSTFLSAVNLSSSTDGKWKFELKTLPRLKGRSSRVIITEYDLPRRASQPHDVAVAPDGMIWYSDVGNAFIGRLNPKTGETKEWPVVNKEPEMGVMGIECVRIDRDGNPVVGIENRQRTGRFNVKTETMQMWDVGGSKAAPSPDGSIWGKDDKGQDSLVYRIDPKTGESVSYPVPEHIRFYDIDVDSKGNVYGSSLEQSRIGQLDAKTGKWTIYKTPTPDSGSRRGDVDRQDRYWFGEYYAGKIGMFDPKTKQIKEWDIPTVPWEGPYDVVVDKNGEVWTGGEYTDNVSRLNPVTGQVTTYPMPTLEMNMQRVDVDNSTNPVTIWTGENHRAKIARIEPLD